MRMCQQASFGTNLQVVGFPSFPNTIQLGQKFLTYVSSLDNLWGTLESRELNNIILDSPHRSGSFSALVAFENVDR